MLETQLSAFVSLQRTIGDSRIANVTRLRQTGADAEARRDRALAIEREVGLSERIDLYEKLRVRAVESARQQANTSSALETARTSLEDTQKKVEVQTTALRETAKSLSSVSGTLSIKGHAEMLFSFFSNVANNVQKAQDDAKKAKTDGDKQANTAKETVKANP